MYVSESVGFIISNTGRKLSQALTARFQPRDITSEQWSVLKKLAEEDGITQKELSNRIEKDPTNVTRILDQLERKGWIRRAANREDRRSFLTHITEAGRELSKELTPIEAQFVEQMLHGLSAQDVAVLRGVFKQINKNIDIRH
ncbi:MarR family winged helix-turn-helix transcriptional regulator [Paenibacillus xerothermodurans]|uniref:MarR family transcriptional regulator n=1 Tax=Paenibacillus xerothermodurans TaxID=1977292 RepID=A0A2W1NBF5_PAEXE|nr:MarR family transcriptional regulator [Paenibacillus xerothermodurans]PZE21234.1 MarR family transcriptional regulator [Paenibacillus xerothermodurans]